MKKKLFFKKFSLLIFIFALMGGIISIFGFRSNASTNVPPVPYNVRIQHSPSGGAFVSANGSTVTLNLLSNESSRSVRFIAKATDANGNKVGVQVMYRRSTEAFWRSYGTKPAEDPDGHHPDKTPVSNCPGDISSSHPKCGSYPNKQTSGYNDYGWKLNLNQNTEVTSGTVVLSPGTWVWRTRAFDYYDSEGHTSYSKSWSTAYTIKINSYQVVAPAPSVQPTPVVVAPTQPVVEEPDYSDGGDNYSEYEPSADENYDYETGSYEGYADEDYDSEEYTYEDSNSDDTEAPTEPSGLKGEYNSDQATINLFWTESTDNIGIYSYEIERTLKTEEKWEVIDESYENSYADFTAEPGKNYKYRVRAKDEANNYSKYSNTFEILMDRVKYNVTKKDGGEVTSKDKSILIVFPPGSVSEDVFVLIENMDIKTSKIKVDDKFKLFGIYEILAKNGKGELLKSFKTQIQIIFDLTKVNNNALSTAKIGYIKSDGSISYLKHTIDYKKKYATILTDHFSVYFVSIEKATPLEIFFRIIFWIAIVAGILAAGYFGYQFWQRKNYQEEHSEDYIYKH